MPYDSVGERSGNGAMQRNNNTETNDYSDQINSYANNSKYSGYQP